MRILSFRMLRYVTGSCIFATLLTFISSPKLQLASCIGILGSSHNSIYIQLCVGWHIQNSGHKFINLDIPALDIWFIRNITFCSLKTFWCTIKDQKFSLELTIMALNISINPRCFQGKFVFWTCFWLVLVLEILKTLR